MLDSLGVFIGIILQGAILLFVCAGVLYCLWLVLLPVIAFFISMFIFITMPFQMMIGAILEFRDKKK